MRLKQKYDVRISTFISFAGEEVLRMYGFRPKISEISHGKYYEEIFLSRDEGASFPITGRLQRGKYVALVVSPCSANTVAKIACGIADTIVTNAVSQAEKTGVPIILLPTDRTRSEAETFLPYLVGRELCKGCEECPAITVCKLSAITLVDGKARINLSKCLGCGLCLQACSFGAIVFHQKVKTRAREIDVRNVRELRKRRLVIAKNPSELEKVLTRFLKGLAKAR